MHNNFVTKEKETKMVSKKNWARMLVIVLIFGITAIGLFFPARVYADDMWANVPNLGMLNGTWKASISQNITYREYMELTGTPMSPDEKVPDMKSNFQLEMTMVFDTKNSTVSISGTYKRTDSGADIEKNSQGDAKVSEIKYPDATIVIDDVNHIRKYTFFYIVSYNERFPMNFQINQTGAKIKTESLDLGGNGWSVSMKDFKPGSSIILMKQ